MSITDINMAMPCRRFTMETRRHGDEEIWETEAPPLPRRARVGGVSTAPAESYV